jgi:(p)ppGpp synthase/HD superfamily hydrolase
MVRINIVPTSLLDPMFQESPRRYHLRKESRMKEATILTDRFDRALLYAAYIHGGQTRKETGIPYIAHLLAVSATVLEYGGSEDIAIAALLHDAVEDQGGTPRLHDIRNRFGDRVADIVRDCSDSTSHGEKKEDWSTRKARYLAHLENVDDETLLVSLADKVHNARSILRDAKNPEIGRLVWDRFKKPKDQTVGYYARLAEVFSRRWPRHQLADEMRHLAKKLAEV